MDTIRPSPAFKPTDGEQSYEFKLKKGKDLGGVVLLPNGKPTRDATVVLLRQVPILSYKMAN